MTADPSPIPDTDADEDFEQRMPLLTAMCECESECFPECVFSLQMI